METIIICFSQTGHTQKVSEEIQKGIESTGGQCSIIPLSEVSIKDLANYDLIGLGTPVFYFQPPFHVTEFISGLPSQQGSPWFIFCIHGSVMGMTLKILAEHLEQKGARVIGSHHTYADGTIPFYPYPTVTTGHPDDQDLDKAKGFGERIMSIYQKVTDGNDNAIEAIPEITDEWTIEEAKMLNKDFLNNVMPKLSINGDSCSQCGDCEESCPVEGIDISTEPPRIQDPCIFCWNCAKICPNCAIETDWTGLVAMAPRSYERYIQALKNAEARGEFRWHVDPNDMNYDDPLYKQQLRKKEIK